MWWPNDSTPVTFSNVQRYNNWISSDRLCNLLHTAAKNGSDSTSFYSFTVIRSDSLCMAAFTPVIFLFFHQEVPPALYETTNHHTTCAGRNPDIYHTGIFRQQVVDTAIKGHCLVFALPPVHQIRWVNWTHLIWYTWYTCQSHASE